MRADLSDCVFCRIGAGAAPAHLVSENDTCFAFLDHAPAAMGHTLVAPRKHVELLWHADGDLAADVLRMTRDVAELLYERLGCDGLTLRQNNGAASGQVVPHLHVHLVPRWHGDGTIGWPRPIENPHDPLVLLSRLRGE